jgi:hypothetical protein
MERRLRAVESMDPVESATILSLPTAGAEDVSRGDPMGAVDDELSGLA